MACEFPANLHWTDGLLVSFGTVYRRVLKVTKIWNFEWASLLKWNKISMNASLFFVVSAMQVSLSVRGPNCARAGCSRLIRARMLWKNNCIYNTELSRTYQKHRTCVDFAAMRKIPETSKEMWTNDENTQIHYSFEFYYCRIVLVVGPAYKRFHGCSAWASR